MSLQRRILLYLLICAPLVWIVALVVSVGRARVEVNELFDTQTALLAREVEVILQPAGPAAAAAPGRKVAGDQGDSDVKDMAIAAWDREGRLLMSDREGLLIPHRPRANGFVDIALRGERWRVYYLQATDGATLVAAAQRLAEREELVWDLTVSQILPWLTTLPVLLVAMGLAVRQALAPLRELTRSLEGRSADELEPLAMAPVPAELEPLVAAMNRLFHRIEATLAQERRFTADAAHELRTPLAVLRAQWDVVRRSTGPRERHAAEAKLTAGIDRLDRLVTQMLALARVERSGPPSAPAAVAWPAIVEQAMSDCLALAERRNVDLACDWPPDGRAALPLRGDPYLLTVMLRNLLDNAVRYAPAGSSVRMEATADALVIDNAGEPLGAEPLARLGERFYRPAGQEQSGSGLGISIARRVAALHGLELAFSTVEPGAGVRVSVQRTSAPP